MQITPEQQKQIDSWAIQRDIYLKELSDLRNQIEILKKKDTELSGSVSSATTTLNEIKGSIKVLEGEEQKRSELISKELSNLVNTKNSLQIEITGLSKEVELLFKTKESLTKDIELLNASYTVFHRQSGGLEKTIERVVKTGEDNINIINGFTSNLKKDLSDIQINITHLNDTVYKRLQDMNAVIDDHSKSISTDKNIVKEMVIQLGNLINNKK